MRFTPPGRQSMTPLQESSGNLSLVHLPTPVARQEVNAAGTHRGLPSPPITPGPGITALSPWATKAALSYWTSISMSGEANTGPASTTRSTGPLQVSGATLPPCTRSTSCRGRLDRDRWPRTALALTRKVLSPVSFQVYRSRIGAGWTLSTQTVLRDNTRCLPLCLPVPAA